MTNWKLEKCLPPLLQKREHKTILDKIQTAMKREEFEYLVLIHEQDIYYATGYIPLMPSSVAVVPAEGDAILIVSTLESEAAYCLTTDDVDVREFMSWVFIDDGSQESRREKDDVLDPDGPINMTIDILMKRPLQGKVGIDIGKIAKSFWGKLIAKVPESSFADCKQLLEGVRIFKTPWEIDMLRLAAQEAEKSWKMIVEDLKPGIPAWKLDALYVYYAGKLNLEHGTMSRRHVFLPASGPYFGLPGMPRGYILQKGDVIKFDSGFRYYGYTSDIARTFAVGGEASDKAHEVYNTLYKAQRLGVSMLKPGVRFCDIYKAIREEVEKSALIPHYPRGNVGHSIGCGHHAEEYPKISPKNDMVIKQDMVLCLETPYSATGNAPVVGGFNIEDTYAITENGYEAFTEAPDNILWK